MATLKLYTTAAEIDAACAKFLKAGLSLQKEAHKLACSVLKHVGEHGDIRVVTKFIGSFTDMARLNAVRAWFEEFGPVAFEAGDKIAYVKGKTTRLGEAMDKPFYEFKKEEAYKPLNPVKALDQLIKRLEHDAKVTGRDHMATIAALKLVPAGNAPTVTTVQ